MSGRASASTRVVRLDTLPPPRDFGPGAVLLYDRSLSRRVPNFSAFAQAFPGRVAVRAGEALKDVGSFASQIGRLVDAFSGRSRAQSTLVCAGGGSVGDFGGFAASVIQRGIGLVHIPTTWLAAVDSAHGGKTALNVGGAKNQIGTFYPAQRVVLIKNILTTQPEKRAREGMAELVKMAFIDGGPWAGRLLAEALGSRTRNEVLWQYAPPAMAAKGRVVKRDPHETKGGRQVLNLGHTVGHILEAHHRLPHGVAVAQGIHFALDWSAREAGLSGRSHRALADSLSRLTGEVPASDRLGRVPRRSFTALLTADKKADRGPQGAAADVGVKFVFLRGLGSPLRRRVTVGQVVDAARRSGWVA